MKGDFRLTVILTIVGASVWSSLNLIMIMVMPEQAPTLVRVGALLILLAIYILGLLWALSFCYKSGFGFKKVFTITSLGIVIPWCYFWTDFYYSGAYHPPSGPVFWLAYMAAGLIPCLILAVIWSGLYAAIARMLFRRSRQRSQRA